jgi:hypothetical protein
LRHDGEFNLDLGQEKQAWLRYFSTLGLCDAPGGLHVAQPAVRNEGHIRNDKPVQPDRQGSFMNAISCIAGVGSWARVFNRQHINAD